MSHKITMKRYVTTLAANMAHSLSVRIGISYFSTHRLSLPEILRMSCNLDQSPDLFRPLFFYVRSGNSVTLILNRLTEKPIFTYRRMLISLLIFPLSLNCLLLNVPFTPISLERFLRKKILKNLFKRESFQISAKSMLSVGLANNILIPLGGRLSVDCYPDIALQLARMTELYFENLRSLPTILSPESMSN